MTQSTTLLAVTAHPGDFVWRAGGALALTAQHGGRAVIACLTFGSAANRPACGGPGKPWTR